VDQGNLRTNFSSCKGKPACCVIFPFLVFVIIASGFSGAEVWGKEAPEFQAYTLEGYEVSKEALRGEPALLMFWAPWCGVCKRELPHLADFYETEKPDWLQVISVGGSDTHANVQAYVDEHPGVFVFHTVYDEEKIMASDFRVKAVPSYVLLDGKGNIILSHLGSGFLNKAAFRKFISSLP
jgi:thiol-disulfide isomerase/thioredoxin